MANLRVLVSGAGLGGLCLAQALRRAGVDVEVFERDHSPWDRPQGYRLHMDSDGVGALADALPPALFALFEATAMRAEPFTTLLDTDLAVRQRVRDEVRGEDDPARVTRTGHHVNVNRATVRQILLAGLDGVVHFSAALTGYESDETGVTAHFADGSSARGDLLVGADGISRPRSRRPWTPCRPTSPPDSARGSSTRSSRACGG